MICVDKGRLVLKHVDYADAEAIQSKLSGAQGVELVLYLYA